MKLDREVILPEEYISEYERVITFNITSGELNFDVARMNLETRVITRNCLGSALNFLLVSYNKA